MRENMLGWYSYVQSLLFEQHDRDCWYSSNWTKYIMVNMCPAKATISKPPVSSLFRLKLSISVDARRRELCVRLVIFGRVRPRCSSIWCGWSIEPWHLDARYGNRKKFIKKANYSNWLKFFVCRLVWHYITLLILLNFQLNIDFPAPTSGSWRRFLREEPGWHVVARHCMSHDISAMLLTL